MTNPLSCRRRRATTPEPGGSAERQRAALRWAAVVCALVALVTVLPRAQVVPGAIASADYHRWMGELFSRKPAAMDQSLARIILPGTHDSGTYRLSLDRACDGCLGSDLFINAEASCREYLAGGFEHTCDEVMTFMGVAGQAWGQAQHLTVGGQLRAGARRLDLRFFRATAEDAARTEGRLVPGMFYIHHSLAGPESLEILQDIDDFLADPSNASEIVILEFTKMMEGDDAMDAATLRLFFDRLRVRFGAKMARKQVAACVGDPNCSATERYGHATTVREFLAQGSQVIVTCSCDADAPDIWDEISGISAYSVENLDSSAGAGYPAPDNDAYPWRTDSELLRMLQDLSATRDSHPQDEMWVLGTEIGLDERAQGIWSYAVCRTDTANVSGICDAVNDDWDELQGLHEAAAFARVKTLAALVSLRRDRVNIVTADHYVPEFTEEVFKLNLGAARVHYGIDRVLEQESVDATSSADFYPVFFYSGVSPLSPVWQVLVQRYNQIPNDGDITPHWPGWKSYPNDWGTATILFGISDADPVGDDDRSPIHVGGPLSPLGSNPLAAQEQVPITGCVENGAACLNFEDLQVTRAPSGVENSALVEFRRSVCTWSWLPGDIVDPASLCGEAPPQLTVRDVLRQEGTGGSTGFAFEIVLSRPSLVPVTVAYSTVDGTAVAGDDYTAVVNRVVTFPPGETRMDEKVFVNGDSSVESDESFSVNLSQPSGAGIEDGVANAFIEDDDVRTLRIGDRSRNEGDAGVTHFNFLVTLDDASSETVTVHYATRNGSAVAGTDYTAVTDGFLTFAPGQTTREVIIDVIGDRTIEADETFFVSLSGAVNARIAVNDGEGTAVVTNDDTRTSMTPPADQSGVEGASIGFDLGTVADGRPAGPWTIQVNWGDLASNTYSVVAEGPLTRPHTYKDNGIYTVTVSAIDADGVPSNAVSFTATIANVNPEASLGNRGPVDEGSPVTIAFTGAVDPSSPDAAAGFHFAYSCTNDSLATATYASSSSAATTSCTFADDGVHTVRGRIIDKDGGATEYTTTVTVTDVAPSLSVPPGQSGTEGSSVAFGLGTLADAGADGPWTITVDWGDTQVESYSVTAVGALTRSHAYADNGAYTVSVSATDEDQIASNTVAVAAAIANVSPVVTAVGSIIDENGVASVSGQITDPGVHDTFVLTVSWGDGTSSQHSLAAGSTTYTVSHQYPDDSPTGTASDIAPVTVAVTDKDGGAGSSSTGVTLNNVPPVVGSLVLTDEMGAAIGGDVVALSGLPVNLEVAFTDTGTLDTHTGAISWGDGTSGAGVVTESGGSGMVRAAHTWSAPGSVTVGITVTDDDTGVGTREVTVVVVDAAGAVCGLAQTLTPMLSEPGLPAETVAALTSLLGQIRSNNDGLAANGACDMFAKGNWVAAVVKLDQAVQTIEMMIAGGSLIPAQAVVLRQVEARLILAAKWTHLTLARTTTDPQKLAAAVARAALADAATASRDYMSAIGHWLAAVRLLAPTE